MSRGRDKSQDYSDRSRRDWSEQRSDRSPDTPPQRDYIGGDLPGEPTTDAKDPKKKKS